MNLKGAFEMLFGCCLGGDTFHEMEFEFVKAFGPDKSKAFKILFDAKINDLLVDLSGKTFKDAKGVFDHFYPYFAGKKREEFHAIYLDNKHRIIESNLISIGTINQTIVGPREVFRRGVELSAVAVICLHNHPAGVPEPSNQDIAISNRLKECGDIIGIRFLDSIIIANDTFFSFIDEGLF